MGHEIDRNSALTTVVYCLGHKYPCRPLMDLAKVFSVPMGSTQCLSTAWNLNESACTGKYSTMGQEIDRNPALTTVELCHCYRYPCLPLMDLAKVSAVPMARGSTQCLDSLESV